MNFKTPAMRIIKTVFVVFVVLFLIGGGLTYAEAFIAGTIDHGSANGTPVKIDGKIYGSYLLAEAFNYSIFFQPRASATDYNLSSSAGFSWSLDNPVFLNQTRNLTIQFMKENNITNMSDVPSTMVLYSASGLDPDIPLSGALVQMPRVSSALAAFASNVTGYNWTEFVNKLVSENIRQNFPIFGSQYVNVVTMNFEIIRELISLGVISSSFLQ